MPVLVLIGFAGVLVAAVATGMLAGRCARQPRTGSVVWMATALGLTIALAAQSMGFASGFDQTTFRAIQLAGLLLAPLGLAWGLVELVVENEAARFGTRLIASALAVVASVILATDPLGSQPFSKAWPLTGAHFQPISRSALDVVQAVAVLAALVCAGLVLAGRGSRAPLAAVVPPVLAVFMTVGLRFALPAMVAYPLLSTMAAALVWFGASRARELSGRVAPPGRAGERKGRRGGVGDGGGRYRPEDGFPPGNQYVTYGQRDVRPVPGRPPGDFPGVRPGAAAMAAGSPAAAARPYGRIQIFTLLDDRVADFDRLAEETAEQVSAGEPDTLVYVIHLVPNAPLQRIFYEIYRDRAAFDSHESRPYMQRFAAERRSLVLATNVIELRLKYAKVAPLPGQPPRPPAGGRGPQPAGAAGPPRPQPPPPLPPPPPPGAGPGWPQRPDQRQVPSAGRRHSGG